MSAPRRASLTDKLLRQLMLMKAYLQLKLDQRDWHGVADAAMDIREIEAVLRSRGIKIVK